MDGLTWKSGLLLSLLFCMVLVLQAMAIRVVGALMQPPGPASIVTDVAAPRPDAKAASESAPVASLDAAAPGALPNVAEAPAEPADASIPQSQETALQSALASASAMGVPPPAAPPLEAAEANEAPVAAMAVPGVSPQEDRPAAMDAAGIEGEDGGLSGEPFPATGPSADDQGSAWLLDAASGHFTLQVQSGTHLAGLEQFAAAHPLPQPWSIYRTTRNGRPWYALVAGEYPDAREAQAAAAELAGRVRSLKPWARSIGDVRAQME